MKPFDSLHQAVYDGDVQKVEELTETFLKEGGDAVKILNHGLIASLEKIGKEFSSGLLFLPEVMLSAHAIHKGIHLLGPLLVEAGVEPRGSILIGTVKGDQHDIGKNIVAMMLRGSGFRVKDLGIDVEPEAFVAAAGEGDIQILAMSTLLTTSLPWVEKTILALETAGLREKVKVLVGGAVMDQDRAQEVSADGFASDAARAVDACKALLDLAPTP